MSLCLLLIICQVVLVWLLSACSQESNGLISKTYHNTTAHYNAYYLARERLQETESKIFTERKDDYNQILDVILPVDSVLASGLKTLTEYSVQKSSIAIQRHKNSKWLDDSYLVLGKSRFYQFDLPKALETYKYVNSTSDSRDARQQALLGIFRTYLQQQEYAKAKATINYIKQEKLSKKHLGEFYLIRAQMHKEQEEYKQAAATLALAVPLLSKGERRARVYFIMGQLNQLLGNQKEAFKNFRSTLKNNPTYELAFNARLYMIQNFQLKKENDTKKLMALFKKMLRDAKNIDYKDKIYYQMALFEQKQKNYEKAISYLKKSAQANTKDQTQKGYTFLRLGEIYFENLQEYELAKSYYDSTVQVLPPTAENFDAISKRQKVLGDFVQQVVTIQTEDSLQKLAQMDSVSLNRYLDDIVAQEEAQRKKEEAKARRAMQGESDDDNPFPTFDTGDNSNTNRPGNMGNASGSGNQWYFNNPALISQGRTAFLRKWGNRKLEDNWRRSTKEASTNFDADNPQEKATAANTPSADEATKAPAENFAATRKAEIKATIPSTPEALASSNKKIEDAYYNLGKIYNLELEEPENSVSTFEKLLTRYPETNYKPEVYYFLYLIHKNLAQTQQQEDYKNKLLSQYPKSTFAKLTQNANFVRDENLNDLHVQDKYTQAFQLYEMQNYEEAQILINEALASNPSSSLAERLNVLKILIIGRTKNVTAFRNALNEFIQANPQSELLPYVQNLLKSSENFAKRTK